MSLDQLRRQITRTAAILLDVFLIRCLILPAIMGLLGERAWWLPRWLARRVPRVAIEREQVST